ncbi:sulfotransferase domain-containing protein [Synechocystis sp. PCC 7509]|uniref:sulfotransferase domain-containing protein n=1 Tax=Synechocystis sp. PCC 7509 TaxID=927677 RepID=UPI0002AC1A6A|nr:sulfotransferase domain-containing protein [Synechocystis sp. PCC 7509]
MLKTNVRKILNIFKESKSNIEISTDDIFLVSYPKSGNTWLRFLLANYLTDNQCNFDNAHLLIPGIHFTQKQSISSQDRLKFVKSHQPFTGDYHKVIYLVRDGKDVAVSYYFHAKKFGIVSKEETFEDFLIKFNAGKVDNYTAWSDHVNSWLNNPTKDFLLIKYEDLKLNPYFELIRVLKFAKIVIDTKLVKSAVEASSFESMKKLELERKEQIIKDLDPSIQFVRNGKIGEAEMYFNQELMTNFIAVHGLTLKQLGYL